MDSAQHEEAPTLALTLQEAVGGRARTACVGGEIDIATAPALAEFLGEVLSTTSGALVVDVTGVTFMDSSGVRALDEARREAARRRLDFAVLCPVDNKPVQRVIQALRLGSVMTIIAEHPEPEVQAC